MEPSAFHILCIHHKNTIVGNNEQLTTLVKKINNLQIPQPYVEIAPTTQQSKDVNKNKEWNTYLLG